MALYQWISSVERDGLERRLLECFKDTGLEIDPEFSNGKIIYARDGDGCKCAWNARVNIMISPSNCSASEYVVEVRSSEPMLKKETQCEQVATKVKIVIPPKS